MNDGAVKSGDREKGFYSIGGALRYFLEDEIDVARKHDMRERILQGPPFSAQEQRDILDYCEDDVRALARLLPHIVPTIRPPFAHAMFRAKFQWAIAQQERRGIPMDGALLARLRHQWQDMRLDLVTELDRPFGCFEVVDGRRALAQAAVCRLRPPAPDELADAMRRQTRRDGSRPFARWPASTRTSSRCASCAIRCRSCGSTILRSEATTATARRCGRTAPRPAATRPARRNSCSARPSGCGF